MKLITLNKLFLLTMMGILHSHLIAQKGLVEDVKLDRTTVFTVCPLAINVLPSTHCECSRDQAAVGVSVAAKNAEADSTFYYFISGGRIIGEGSTIVWDLSNAPAGEYSLTVGLGKDNIIWGKTVTRKLIVKDCPVCDPGCSCPSIYIEGPNGEIQRSNSFLVRSKVSGSEESKKELRYKWSVVGATIIAGDGTSQILIKAKPYSLNVEVKLHVDGLDISCNCPSEFSEKFNIVKL